MKNHLSILEPTLSAHFKAINRAYQNTNIARFTELYAIIHKHTENRYLAQDLDSLAYIYQHSLELISNAHASNKSYIIAALLDLNSAELVNVLNVLNNTNHKSNFILGLFVYQLLNPKVPIKDDLSNDQKFILAKNLYTKNLALSNTEHFSEQLIPEFCKTYVKFMHDPSQQNSDTINLMFSLLLQHFMISFHPNIAADLIHEAIQVITGVQKSCHAHKLTNALDLRLAEAKLFFDFLMHTNPNFIQHIDTVLLDTAKYCAIGTAKFLKFRADLYANLRQKDAKLYTCKPWNELYLSLEELINNYNPSNKMHDGSKTSLDMLLNNLKLDLQKSAINLDYEQFFASFIVTVDIALKCFTSQKHEAIIYFAELNGEDLAHIKHFSHNNQNHLVARYFFEKFNMDCAIMNVYTLNEVQIFHDKIRNKIDQHFEATPLTIESSIEIYSKPAFNLLLKQSLIDQNIPLFAQIITSLQVLINKDLHTNTLQLLNFLDLDSQSVNLVLLPLLNTNQINFPDEQQNIAITNHLIDGILQKVSLKNWRLFRDQYLLEQEKLSSVRNRMFSTLFTPNQIDAKLFKQKICVNLQIKCIEQNTENYVSVAKYYLSISDQSPEPESWSNNVSTLLNTVALNAENNTYVKLNQDFNKLLTIACYEFYSSEVKMTQPNYHLAANLVAKIHHLITSNKCSSNNLAKLGIILNFNSQQISFLQNLAIANNTNNLLTQWLLQNIKFDDFFYFSAKDVTLLKFKEQIIQELFKKYHIKTSYISAQTTYNQILAFIKQPDINNMQQTMEYYQLFAHGILQQVVADPSQGVALIKFLTSLSKGIQKIILQNNLLGLHILLELTAEESAVTYQLFTEYEVMISWHLLHHPIISKFMLKNNINSFDAQNPLQSIMINLQSFPMSESWLLSDGYTSDSDLIEEDCSEINLIGVENLTELSNRMLAAVNNNSIVELEKIDVLAHLNLSNAILCDNADKYTKILIQYLDTWYKICKQHQPGLPKHNDRLMLANQYLNQLKLGHYNVYEFLRFGDPQVFFVKILDMLPGYNYVHSSNYASLQNFKAAVGDMLSTLWIENMTTPKTNNMQNNALITNTYQAKKICAIYAMSSKYFADYIADLADFILFNHEEQPESALAKLVCDEKQLHLIAQHVLAKNKDSLQSCLIAVILAQEGHRLSNYKNDITQGVDAFKQDVIRHLKLSVINVLNEHRMFITADNASKIANNIYNLANNKVTLHHYSTLLSWAGKSKKFLDALPQPQVKDAEAYHKLYNSLFAIWHMHIVGHSFGLEADSAAAQHSIHGLSFDLSGSLDASMVDELVNLYLDKSEEFKILIKQYVAKFIYTKYLRNSLDSKVDVEEKVNLFACALSSEITAIVRNIVTAERLFTRNDLENLTILPFTVCTIGHIFADSICKIKYAEKIYYLYAHANLGAGSEFAGIKFSFIKNSNNILDVANRLASTNRMSITTEQYKSIKSRLGLEELDTFDLQMQIVGNCGMESAARPLFMQIFTFGILSKVVEVTNGKILKDVLDFSINTATAVTDKLFAIQKRVCVEKLINYFTSTNHSSAFKLPIPSDLLAQVHILAINDSSISSICSLIAKTAVVKVWHVKQAEDCCKNFILNNLIIPLATYKDAVSGLDIQILTKYASHIFERFIRGEHYAVEDVLSLITEALVSGEHFAYATSYVPKPLTLCYDKISSKEIVHENSPSSPGKGNKVVGLPTGIQVLHV